MNRRDALKTITATAVASPSVGQTRERRIGWGRDPDSDELLHEEFAIDRWDGSQWVDTHERRAWWLRGGYAVERRWKLTRLDLEFLKGNHNDHER